MPVESPGLQQKNALCYLEFIIASENALKSFVQKIPVIQDNRKCMALIIMKCSLQKPKSPQ